MTHKRKVEITVDVVKTPVGEVPTVETVERIIDGLNLLSEDMSTLSLSFSETLKSLTAEVKSIQKIIAKETLSSEVAVNAIKRLEQKLDDLSREEAERWRRLQHVLSIFSEALRALYNMESKTSSKLEKLISLLTMPPLSNKKPDKKVKPLKKVV